MKPSPLPTQAELRARRRTRKAAQPTPAPWPPAELALPDAETLERLSQPAVLPVPMGARLIAVLDRGASLREAEAGGAGGTVGGIGGQIPTTSRFRTDCQPDAFFPAPRWSHCQ